MTHRLLLLLPLALALPLEAQLTLRQSDAVEIVMGPFLDATDGITAETALTISQADVRLKKCTAAGDCAAFAQANESTSAAHDENGLYEKDLDTTDTNTVGILHVCVFESGAMPWCRAYHIVEEAVYDACCSSGATALVDLVDGAVDAGAIANSAIDAATFAADVDAEVLSYIVDDATRIDASELNGDIDSLAFGVAGQANVNVESINTVPITGDGAATPFGVSFRQFRRFCQGNGSELCFNVTRAAFKTLQERAIREFAESHRLIEVSL